MQRCGKLHEHCSHLGPVQCPIGIPVAMLPPNSWFIGSKRAPSWHLTSVCPLSKASQATKNIGHHKISIEYLKVINSLVFSTAQWYCLTWEAREMRPPIESELPWTASWDRPSTWTIHVVRFPAFHRVNNWWCYECAADRILDEFGTHWTADLQYGVFMPYDSSTWRDDTCQACHCLSEEARCWR